MFQMRVRVCNTLFRFFEIGCFFLVADVFDQSSAHVNNNMIGRYMYFPGSDLLPFLKTWVARASSPGGFSNCRRDHE